MSNNLNHFSPHLFSFIYLYRIIKRNIEKKIMLGTKLHKLFTLPNHYLCLVQKALSTLHPQRYVADRSLQ